MGRLARKSDSPALLCFKSALHISQIRFSMPRPVPTFRDLQFVNEAYTSKTKIAPVFVQSGDSNLTQYMLPILRKNE